VGSLDHLHRFIGSQTYPCNYSDLPQLQGFHSTRPSITLSSVDFRLRTEFLVDGYRSTLTIVHSRRRESRRKQMHVISPLLLE
jgi:hypothetical protein